MASRARFAPIGVPMCLIAVIAGMIMGACPAFACTAVYVGKDASADGTTIIAKSNDYQAVWPNYVEVTERVENEPGRAMPIDNGKTVLAPLPDTTYRYTSTPWMDSATATNGLAHDATVCANEYGVVMEMSITSFSNKAALAADPLIEHGLSEFTAVDLVICQSATAREAVEVLCGLIDEYGSSEVNIAFIADQQEAWYVEMYSGHQYAAVKLPTDKVSAFGNEFSLEFASDYADSIFSADLTSLPEQKGFAQYGTDDKASELNLRETYAGHETRTDYSHMRTWIGHQLLAGGYGEYRIDDEYPLCFDPGQKVSLQDVMQIIRNRFEGTEYAPDEKRRTDMRVIGTDTALSVHIAQIYPDLPASRSCVTWESAGPAIYGVFVPVSNAVTSISEPYNANQRAGDKGTFDTERYPYYAFKALCTLCVEPNCCKTYGSPVRDYWSKVEGELVAGMGKLLQGTKSLDDAEAAKRITEYCNRSQEQAFSDAKTLLNDVMYYMNSNSNTLKNGRNPETGEVLDELRELKPLEVKLDSSAYALSSPEEE